MDEAGKYKRDRQASW